MDLITNNDDRYKWFLTKTAPDAYSKPDSIENNTEWNRAIVPGTVAQSLECLNTWNINCHKNFDDSDWWYKTSFPSDLKNNDCTYIDFEGLATICEIWLNGDLLLTTDNMFKHFHLNLTDKIQKNNELYLCFRSLNKHLGIKRKRPSWKTRLIKNQQLRWVRTTLLGKIPGWTPPVSAVGPWKPILITNGNYIRNLNLQSKVISNNGGEVEFKCDYIQSTVMPEQVKLKIGDTETLLTISKSGDHYSLHGKLNIPKIDLWFPHTHGTPVLYNAKLEIKVNDSILNINLPSIGFKTIELDIQNNDFNIKINNRKIFCRGAVWTNNDIISLVGNESELEKTLVLMKKSGANMIRIGGTMCYEQDKFYSLCDQLGIMIWQDFMFANMDYPGEDEHFLNSVKDEIRQQLNRLSPHPSLTIYCGNSEIQQQVCMMGLNNESYNNIIFDKIIPQSCQELHTEVPYIPSTPTGGSLPIHTDKNLSHYYGIGAYLSDISDLRRHNVKFTSECLGFSNLPDLKSRNSILDGEIPVIHNPEWKRRTPRDSSAGWDFEDVRDHYLKSMYDIDPVEARSFDTETYLQYSEICTGEIMSMAFNEWRSNNSQCNGALVWFMKDLWLGAGWGIISANNIPKACYYYLKRSWQPINIHITDEHLNGQQIHCNNESQEPFSGYMKFDIINEYYDIVESTKQNICIKENSNISTDTSTLFQRFIDINYSYKFGPTVYLFSVASLYDSNDNLISISSCLLQNKKLIKTPSECISIKAYKTSNSTYTIKIISEKFIYAASIQSNNCIANDNYFNLLPGTEKNIELTINNENHKKLIAYFNAINIDSDIKIKVTEEKP